MTGIGSRLRELRDSRGLTQSEFSDVLGISLRTYQRYEQDERNLPLRSLFVLAKQDVNIDWIVTGRGEMTRQSVTKLERLQALSSYWEANYRLLELSFRQLNELLVAKFGKEVESIIKQVKMSILRRTTDTDMGDAPAGDKPETTPDDTEPTGD